ncbi:MAG TPA: hypothetical protein VHT28_08965 [Silvibacterium sp.]|nr:hypothetical protein [Silvibacterium sp.]
MPENDFWKGLVTGTLIGMVLAAFAKGDFDRFFRPAPATGFQPEQTFRGRVKGLRLRREASESAGDPTRLSPALTPTRSAAASTQSAVSIDRPGGAPSPSSAAEMLEVPGHPGQLLDHSDPAQPVHSASRTHDLSGSRS